MAQKHRASSPSTQVAILPQFPSATATAAAAAPTTDQQVPSRPGCLLTGTRPLIASSPSDAFRAHQDHGSSAEPGRRRGPEPGSALRGVLRPVPGSRLQVVLQRQSHRLRQAGAPGDDWNGTCHTVER